MKTFVLSAFPACGKSYCFNNLNGEDFKILDSDSSDFSWIKDERGQNTTERNPEFPNNYIRHIKENIGKADIIFVSSHEVVRDALLRNNISFTLIYPHKQCKEEWLERFKNRGNDEKFINFISSNWDKFIEDMDLIPGELENANSSTTSKVVKKRLNFNQFIDASYLYSLTGKVKNPD